MLISRSNPNEPEAGAALPEILVALLIMGGLAVALGQTSPALQRIGHGALFETRLEALARKAVRETRRNQRPTRLLLQRDALVLEGATSARLSLASAAGDVSLIAAAEISTQGVGTIIFLPDGSSSGGKIRIAQRQALRSLEINWFNSSLTWRNE